MTVSAAISAPVSGVDAANVAGTVAGAAGGHDSLVGLFLNADPLVMFIMLLLVVMSIASWAIIFEKWMTFHQLAGRSENFENEFWTAEALDKLLSLKKTEIGAVLFLQVPDEELISRMINRAKTSGRADDADEQVQRRRLDVYLRDTLPVAEHYGKIDKVVEVEGVGSIDEIFRKLTQEIDSRKGV